MGHPLSQGPRLATQRGAALFCFADFSKIFLVTRYQILGTDPEYEAPIGLWVRGGRPHLMATLRSQKMGGMSVRVVTGQRDRKHLDAIRSGEVIKNWTIA